MFDQALAYIRPEWTYKQEPAKDQWDQLNSYSSTIQEDQSEPTLKTVKNFYRKQIRQYLRFMKRLTPEQQQSIKEFELKITAAQFKIPAQTLLEDPTLKDFLEKNHFHKRLEKFNDQLISIGNEIYFRQKASKISWSKIKELMENGTIILNDSGQMINADYTVDGFQIENSNKIILDPNADEETLKKVLRNNFIVVDRTPPDKAPNKWLYLLRTESMKTHSRCRGDHPSRLVVTPWGDIINFGYYPEKIENSFKRKRGVTLIPDPGYYYDAGGQIVTTAFEVDQKDVLTRLDSLMWDRVEFLKGDPNPFKGEVLHLGHNRPALYCPLEYNCTHEVLEDFRAMRINFNPEEFRIDTVEFFFPNVHRYLGGCPVIESVIRFTIDFFLRTLVYFGAGDSHLRSERVNRSCPSAPRLYNNYFHAWQKPVETVSPYKARQVQDANAARCNKRFDYMNAPIITDRQFFLKPEHTAAAASEGDSKKDD